MASQLALLVVVQAQPVPAVTLVEPLVAVAATLALDGEKANVQVLVPEDSEIGDRDRVLVVHPRVVGGRRGTQRLRRAAVGEIGVREVRDPGAARARRRADVVVRHHGAPLRRGHRIAVAVRIGRRAGIHVRVVQRAEVVAQLVREGQVAGGTAAVDHAEAVARAGADPGDAAVLAVLDEQAHQVGGMGVAQRRHFVQVAVATQGQAIEVGIEVAAFVVIDRGGVHQVEAGGDAAVGVRGVGRVDRLLDLHPDRRPGGGGGLLAVNDHHVDGGAAVGRGDGAAFELDVAAAAARRRLLRGRDPPLLGPRRVVGREAARVDLAQRLGAVAIGLQLVRRGDARRAVDQRDGAGDLAVDDGEHRLALVVAFDPAVPGVVAGAAPVDADEVDDHDQAVEELDADPRRDGAGRRIEVLEGDRHRALPGDPALGRPGFLRHPGRIGRRRGGQQHRYPTGPLGAGGERQQAQARGERQQGGGERPVAAGGGTGGVHDLAPVGPVRRLSVKRDPPVREMGRAKRVHPVPVSSAAQTTSLTARLVRRSRCHRTNVP